MASTIVLSHWLGKWMRTSMIPHCIWALGLLTASTATSAAEQCEGRMSEQIDCACFYKKVEELRGEHSDQGAMIRASWYCPNVEWLKQSSYRKCIESPGAYAPRGTDPVEFCRCFAEMMGQGMEAHRGRKPTSNTMPNLLSAAKTACKEAAK